VPQDVNGWPAVADKEMCRRMQTSNIEAHENMAPCSEPMLPAKKKQPLKSERMKNERMDACPNRVSI
jgi:hypothetical protein